MKKLFFILIAFISMPSMAASPILEQALNCKSNCPYFSDVYQESPEFRNAFINAIKKAGISEQDWVPQGVVSPANVVKIGQLTLLESSICEPHNCSHRFDVLYDIDTGKIVGIYNDEDEDVKVYFGDPNETQKRMLRP